MIPTSIGHRPCPSCHGTGTIGSSGSSGSGSEKKEMSWGQQVFLIIIIFLFIAWLVENLASK
jgi:hypothetical protein